MEIKIKDYEIATVFLNDFNNQQLLKSNRDYNKNDCLIDFSYINKVNSPTYLTVQINEQEHITLNPSFLQYINHSCDPNVFFDVETFKLIALRSISKNEEITFFYPSTEWEMIQPFYCFCKSENCLKTIKGAKFIGDSDLKKYKLSPYISRQIDHLSIEIIS